MLSNPRFSKGYTGGRADEIAEEETKAAKRKSKNTKKSEDIQKLGAKYIHKQINYLLARAAPSWAPTPSTKRNPRETRGC